MTEYECTCPPLPEAVDVSPHPNMPVMMYPAGEVNLECEKHGVPAYERMFGKKPKGYE